MMGFYDQYLNMLRQQQVGGAAVGQFGQSLMTPGIPNQRPMGENEMGRFGQALMTPPPQPGLLGGFDDPKTQGLLSAGLSLLNASGPSTTPTSLGQAVGQAGLSGLGAYTNAQKMGIQNALAQAKIANEMKPKQYVVGNNLVSEAGGTTYSGKPEDTNIVRTLRAAGIDPNSPQGRAIIRENLVRPQSVVNMGNALPGKIADFATESRSAAAGAQEQLSTSQRIRSVLDSGNVVTGAGADWKIAALRVADTLGVGGKDDAEKLANTQNVIKGLAQQTLSSRQALKGQGTITDNETALLQRAVSGDVNLTVSELRTILEVNDRIANIRIKNHSQLVERMKAHPDFKAGADFFEVNAPGQQSPQNNDPLGLRKK